MVNKVMDERDIREFVEAEFVHAPVPDDIWRQAVASGWLEAFGQGHDGTELNRLGARLRRQMRHASPVIDDAGRDEARRQLALSSLVAEHARDDPSIREFRSATLDDNLIEPQEVERWIQRHADADGPLTVWLSDVPIPEGQDRRRSSDGTVFTDPPLQLDEQHAARVIGMKTLAYQVPDKEYVQYQPTNSDGVLERLRQTSERAARRYEIGRASCRERV